MHTIIITASITIGLCSFIFVSFAQTFSEWRQERKHTMKFLRKQVAALKTAQAVLHEEGGKAGARMDLEEIEKILEEKQTDLYLTSLGKVNPIYLNNSYVRAGYGFAAAYIKIADEELAAYAKSIWLKKGEIDSLKSQLGRVQRDMEQTIKNIRLLITQDKVFMNDGDRLDMLMGIEEHVEIVGKFLFKTIDDTYTLIRNRKQQQTNDEYVKIGLQ